VRGPRRSAFILPVVLIVIGLLALTMAGFIFFVRAETAGTIAVIDGQQARLAAESGLEEVIASLRLYPHGATAWFDAPQRFRHKLVWAAGYDRESDPVAKSGTRQEVLAAAEPVAAWRFSVVADRYFDPSGTENRSIRFGITPEASKLNLNYATEEQIEALLRPLLADLQVENEEELIAALLDWRDANDDLRPGGAEASYYNTLEPPYSPKNGPFDSVEELLLVKGFSPAILYGEDTNRNGILDPNEDDGDQSFPYYDNRDGILNRGIAPFLTVWSREPDTSLDNKPRINLNRDAAAISEQIERVFTPEEREVCQSTIDFILQLKQQNFNFAQLHSVAELYVGADLPERVIPGEQEQEQPGSGAAAQALAASPITLEQLPYLLDRFSVLPGQSTQGVAGLININTAPARVLALLPELTPEVVGQIVEARATLNPQAARTPAWLLTTGAVDLTTFHAIMPYITTKAYQFHVEVIGYADHRRAFRRYEWVMEMVGPIAQVRYFRDLTPLGLAFPVDDPEIAGEGVSYGQAGP